MKFVTTDEPIVQFCSISCARACRWDANEIRAVDGHLDVCPGCIELSVDDNWQSSNDNLLIYEREN